MRKGRGSEASLREFAKFACRRTGLRAPCLKTARKISADACVAAVPHDVLLDLLPAEWAKRTRRWTGLRHLKTSPITGVHLWFDRQVMTEPFLTLLDHTTQWIFNKTLFTGADETATAGRVQRAAHVGTSAASICSWSSAPPTIWCRARGRKSSSSAAANWPMCCRDARCEAAKGDGNQRSARNVLA